MVDYTSKEDDWQRREDQVIQEDECILVQVGGIEADGRELVFFRWRRGRCSPIERQEPKHGEHPNNVLSGTSVRMGPDHVGSAYLIEEITVHLRNTLV